MAECDSGSGLIVEGLSFKRGARRFGPLSLRVAGGRIVGLLGPNGAGKTSLLRAIAGELKPLAGSIRTSQTDLTHLSGRDRERLGVFVRLPDRRRLRENRSMLEVVAGAISREPKVLVLDLGEQGA
jgi:ABC-type branched-subunit amino acid transport system ATPase component